MMKFVLVGATLILALNSCKKKDTPCTREAGSTVAPASEEQMITDYLTANNITNAVELNNSGLYYTITTQGSTERAEQCSVLRVKYVGKLTNGTIFDQTQGDNIVSFELGTLIEGWKRTLTLIGEGGKIKLYVPPSMGYGSTDRVNPQTGQIIIPKNSVLIFEIELVTIT
ncbi:FKBP-type peptidyl-prolyl cis-trans isomerase [Lacibacter sp. MH-610]|uniref:FKBP-type peptidyl-prolyl cis-trans isomerase n=1 Tax=Lacibacter sp. MH-610 TaxID=3020883 RepID=UPI00389124A9